MTHSLFRNCTRKEEDNVYMGGVLKSSSLRLGQCGVLYMFVHVHVWYIDGHAIAQETL